MTLKELRLPALLLAGIAFAVPTVARAWETEKVARTFPLSANGTVSLDNVNGSVEVTGWDQPEVSIEAEIRGKTAADLKRIRVEFESSATHLTVKTKMEKTPGLLWGDSPRGEVRYLLRVPSGVSLKKISTVNSSIKISGVRGEVIASTVNGRIEAQGLSGGGKFGTVNGSIVADYSATTGVNRIDLDTVNGGCTLRLPDSATGRLRANTVNGSVSCALPVTIEKSSRRSLRGAIGSGSMEISLASVNGSLRVESKPSGPETASKA